jgi:hypothetical protein
MKYYNVWNMLLMYMNTYVDILHFLVKEACLMNKRDMAVVSRFSKNQTQIKRQLLMVMFDAAGHQCIGLKHKSVASQNFTNSS